jgi:hypothetical protein
MWIARYFLSRICGRPHGLLGRLGGTVMARINGRARPRSRPHTDDVQPHDTVLDVWPDAVAGLREIGLVLKPGGRLALAFS